ncbi:MAG: hypothetical protein ACP5JG_03020 [Anaerolineae bacterium]
MKQEKEVPEVELKDKPEDLTMAVEAVAQEATRLVDCLGKALVTTVGDMTSVMILRVDRETRQNLDLLVDAGVAKHRRDAAHRLIKAGIHSEDEVLERVRRTKAQIAALRNEMRALVQAKVS